MLTFPFLTMVTPASSRLLPAEAPADESHAAAKPTPRWKNYVNAASGASVGCRRPGDDHP